MEEVGIKLNLSKCHIGQQEVKFLGHVVSKSGIKPDPENVAGFYRKHIEKL